MHHTFQLYQKHEQPQRQAIKLEVWGIDNYKKWESEQEDQTISWARACGFSGKSGDILWVPSEQMTIKKVIWVMGVKESPWVFAKLMNLLPEGYYSICSQSLEKDYPWHNMLLAWGLASYRFNRYKLGQGKAVYLEIPEDSINKDLLLSELKSTFLVRDLVNTPAEDCTPAFLVEAIEEVADQHQATYFSYQGQDLLDQGFPLVHAVGRASQYQPQVAGFTWGDPGHPRVVLVGKGVCFDSGGLQIKPHQAMATMKKDMGGAAHMLALAQMIMQHKIPVYLELWVAAVENSVARNAFKPGDVFFARNGLSVEIGHTDAEGRLCLADLLAKVTEDACDLVIDYATLTGAQRVALGPEIPAVFTADQSVAQSLVGLGSDCVDPVWPLPLYQGYEATLKSEIADLSSTGSMPLGGAITAALFLQHFIGQQTLWMHLDGGAYNMQAKPGRPKGGEAMGLRTLFAFIQDRYLS